MGLRFNFLMLSQAWGWGDRACVLATEDAEGSVGRPGRRGGCSSLRFTKAARLTLAESLPAAQRPGDSSWSSSALPGEPAGLTLVAGDQTEWGSVRVCTWPAAHTYRRSGPLSVPLQPGHLGAEAGFA